MNNEYKSDNSVAKGGSRAPANYRFQDSQDYAHKVFAAQGNPSKYVKDTQVQNHATSSKGYATSSKDYATLSQRK